MSAPEANAYEFQSQGIIDMLEKLKDKFQDERDTLGKEETNSRHAYEMLVQGLKAEVEPAANAMDNCPTATPISSRERSAPEPVAPE